MRTFIFVLIVLTPKLLFGGLTECTQATCRISVPGATGTGCAFEKTASHLHVLTAAHVVGRNSSVNCEFWKDGALQRKVSGLVLVTAEREDLAIVAIPLQNMGSSVPKPIPLASKSRSLTMKEPISSVGCANGGWGTSWVGHVSGARGQEIHFQPPPASGRSGSALFDKDGTEILGVISARNNSTGEGIAVSVLAVHDVLDRMKTGTPCSPQGSCVPLLGRSQDYMPPDMSETNRKLDAIADLLKQLQGQDVLPATPETTEEKRLSLLQAASMLKELRANPGETLVDGSFGLTVSQILCGALGISGPIGIAIGAAGWLVSRRLGRRMKNGSEDGTEDVSVLESRLVQAITERVTGRVQELLAKKEG